MTDAIDHHVPDATKDPQANYSTGSLIFHWTAAIAVIALFFTHEDALLYWHVAIGLIVSIPLLWRVFFRMKRGFPRSNDQHPFLNFIARIVMLGMLLAIFILTITGILLPLFAGEPYVLSETLQWQAPYAGDALVHDIMEEIHDATGHIIVPLFGLHILGFIKHYFLDKNPNRSRMMKPLAGGK